MVRMAPGWIDAQGIPSHGRSMLASMGIYLFKRDVLVELLDKSEYTDFGKEIFPMSIRARNVHVHLFDGYWEDIGTIRSFYESNLALASANPPFNLIDESNPIFTRARSLAPARILDANVKNALVTNGAFVEDNVTIDNSIIGLRCHVGQGASVKNTIVMGADFYESDCDRTDEIGELPPVGIGSGTVIEGAIVDKNARIGQNCQIANARGPRTQLRHQWRLHSRRHHLHPERRHPPQRPGSCNKTSPYLLKSTWKLLHASVSFVLSCCSR